MLRGRVRGDPNATMPLLVFFTNKTPTPTLTLHQRAPRLMPTHQRVLGNSNAFLRYNKMKHWNSNNPQRIYKDRL